MSVIHLIECINISCWVVFHGKDLPQFVNPFTYILFPVSDSTHSLYSSLNCQWQRQPESFCSCFWSPGTFLNAECSASTCACCTSPSVMIVNWNSVDGNPQWGLGLEVSRYIGTCILSRLPLEKSLQAPVIKCVWSSNSYARWSLGSLELCSRTEQKEVTMQMSGWGGPSAFHGGNPRSIWSISVVSLCDFKSNAFIYSSFWWEEDLMRSYG